MTKDCEKLKGCSRVSSAKASTRLILSVIFELQIDMKLSSGKAYIAPLINPIIEYKNYSVLYSGNVSPRL